MHIEQRNDGECVCARGRKPEPNPKSCAASCGHCKPIFCYPFLFLFYTFLVKFIVFFSSPHNPLHTPVSPCSLRRGFALLVPAARLRSSGALPALSRVCWLSLRALCAYMCFQKLTTKKKRNNPYPLPQKKRYKTAAHTFTIFALNVLCNIGHIFTPRVVPSKACVTAICFAIFPPRTNRSCMCVPLHSMSFFFFALSPSAWGEHFHGRFVSISSFECLHTQGGAAFLCNASLEGHER